MSLLGVERSGGGPSSARERHPTGPTTARRKRASASASAASLSARSTLTAGANAVNVQCSLPLKHVALLTASASGARPMTAWGGCAPPRR